MASSPSRSPLAPTEIFDRLRAQFGDDVVSTAEAHGHLVVTVKAARYPEIATFLRDDPSLDFDFFDFLTAVDYRPKGRGFEVVTHLYSTRRNHHVRLWLKIPNACRADSSAGIGEQVAPARRESAVEKLA